MTSTQGALATLSAVERPRHAWHRTPEAQVAGTPESTAPPLWTIVFSGSRVRGGISHTRHRHEHSYTDLRTCTL